MAAPDEMSAPRRADARRNRERVLEAARVVFAREGIDAQMTAVAAEAGVGVGTVYRHFPTKEELMAALISDRFHRFAATAREEAASEARAWDAFARALHRNLEDMEDDTGTQHLLARKSSGDWELVAPALEELLEALAPLTERAKADGDLRADYHPDDLGMLMNGVCSAMSVPGGGDWRRHLELVLDGLRAR